MTSTNSSLNAPDETDGSSVDSSVKTAGNFSQGFNNTLTSDTGLVELRSGKALFEATRPFAEESRPRSWWCVASTFMALAAVLVTAGLVPWWQVRIAASVVGGLLFVRAFILFHDFQHSALLRGSRFAKGLFYLYGLVALTPPNKWRHSHNFHHANVGKPIPATTGKFSLVTSDVGAYPLMTTAMWRNASFSERVRYRVSRSAFTILFAYVTVFFGGLCLVPFLQDPRKNREAGLSLLVHVGTVVALGILAGWQVAFFAFILPFAIATAAGAYLFYAQHTFKGMRIVPTGEWTHFRGALESSSYMRLGPIMQWFTGNIGYHHVHHLNALIPFYRLPEAMAAIPELQHPHVTSLRPSDVLACLRLKLWDEEKQELVTYREAAQFAASTHSL